MTEEDEENRDASNSVETGIVLNSHSNAILTALQPTLFSSCASGLIGCNLFESGGENVLQSVEGDGVETG